MPNVFETAEPIAAEPVKTLPTFTETAAEPKLGMENAEAEKATLAVSTLSWKVYAFFVWLAGIAILSACSARPTGACMH